MSKEVNSDIEIRREDGGEAVGGSLELGLEVRVLTSVTKSGQSGVEVGKSLGTSVAKSGFP